MKFKLLLGIILLLLLATMLCACANGWAQVEINEDATLDQTDEAIQTETPTELPLVINTSTFLSQEELQRRLPVDNETLSQTASQKNIRALVIPHHTLAANLAAQGIRTLVKQNPSVIVLIGPNHKNIGPKAATTKAVWDAGQGTLQTDTVAVDELLKQNLAEQDDNLFKTEHSIGALIPIIAHYLPKTKVIPIVYYYRYDQETILQTLKQLIKSLPDDAVIIASIDFSHGLTLQKAQEKDQVTAERLKDWDEKAIADADNTYLDSPTILAALMQYLRETDSQDLKIIANTNSGKIMQDSQMICTSYFVLKYASE